MPEPFKVGITNIEWIIVGKCRLILSYSEVLPNPVDLEKTPRH